jgi:hypothetical protein
VPEPGGPEDRVYQPPKGFNDGAPPPAAQRFEKQALSRGMPTVRSETVAIESIRSPSLIACDAALVLGL